VRLYSAESADVWEAQNERMDFKLVRRLVPDAPIDVLDVACYTGQLLAGLPKACRLHGIEPNAAAAAKAEAHGVRLAGQMAMFAVSPVAYRGLHRWATGVHDDMVPPPGGCLTKDHLLCELIKI